LEEVDEESRKRTTADENGASPVVEQNGAESVNAPNEMNNADAKTDKVGQVEDVPAEECEEVTPA
jgi:hypothetical protein